MAGQKQTRLFRTSSSGDGRESYESYKPPPAPNRQSKTANRKSASPLPDELPATDASETSRAAAGRAAGRARGRAREILRDLADHGPSLREEICGRIELPEKSACGPIHRMKTPKDVRHGTLIRVAGRRKTSSGSPADVYEITDEGRAALLAAEDEGRFVNG